MVPGIRSGEIGGQVDVRHDYSCTLASTGTMVSHDEIDADDMVGRARQSLVSSAMMTTPRMPARLRDTASSPMPLSSQWRACDFTKLKWVDAVGDARPVAHVGTDGSGMVVATVDMATALPNTRYDVRVIQTPRAVARLRARRAGRAHRRLQTDAVGGGTTTFGRPRRERRHRRLGDRRTAVRLLADPAEFYTSEFIASI